MTVCDHLVMKRPHFYYLISACVVVLFLVVAAVGYWQYGKTDGGKRSKMIPLLGDPDSSLDEFEQWNELDQKLFEFLDDAARFNTRNYNDVYDRFSNKILNQLQGFPDKTASLIKYLFLADLLGMPNPYPWELVHPKVLKKLTIVMKPELKDQEFDPLTQFSMELKQVKATIN